MNGNIFLSINLILGIMHCCTRAEIASTSLMRVVHSRIIESKFKFSYWPCQWAFRKIEITIFGNIPCCWEHFIVKKYFLFPYISLPSKCVHDTSLPETKQGRWLAIPPAVFSDKSSSFISSVPEVSKLKYLAILLSNNFLIFKDLSTS